MPEDKGSWRILSIQDAPAEARGRFECGKPALDEYLRLYARQNDSKGIGRAWVALGADSHAIAGYYTLGAAQIAFLELPEALRHRLPAYPVPAVRLARLAVDRRHQGQGLGELLLGDAVQRALLAAEQIGILFMTVDAKDASAAAFYVNYGFQPLPGAPQIMVMALKNKGR